MYTPEGVLKNGPDFYQFAARMQHRNGHYVHLMARGLVSRDAWGQAIRMAGISSDISQQQAALAKLEASQAKFRSLATLSADVYWEQDTRFAFTRVESLLGKETAEIVNFSAAYLGLRRWEITCADPQ